MYLCTALLLQALQNDCWRYKRYLIRVAVSGCLKGFGHPHEFQGGSQDGGHLGN